MRVDWSSDVCSSDRKSTRLNSSHTLISYAVFCLKKKININLPCALSQVSQPSLDGLPYSSRKLFSIFHVPFASAPRSPAMACVFFFFFLMIRRPPKFTLFPSTPLFRSGARVFARRDVDDDEGAQELRV